MGTRDAGFSSVEIAAGVAVFGSLLAVAVPAFVRNLHASHLVEATAGLARIQQSSLEFALANDARSLPSAAPLTPPTVPRGVRLDDPPGAWDHPSWKAIAFRPVPEGMTHRFSFAIDERAPGADLVAHAHGDLDGDGVLSRFEVRVQQLLIGGEVRAVPGMIVEDELE